jgi:hypothetical protein
MNTKERINQSKKVSEGKLDRVMESQQFDRIVEAILAGKYSWACVLILRFAGYNPLHYIPYRTYNRLIKNNFQQEKINSSPKRCQPERPSLALHSSPTSSHLSSNRIKDLSYLETISSRDRQHQGGNRTYLDRDWSRENNSNFTKQLVSMAQTSDLIYDLSLI